MLGERHLRHHVWMRHWHTHVPLLLHTLRTHSSIAHCAHPARRGIDSMRELAAPQSAERMSYMRDAARCGQVVGRTTAQGGLADGGDSRKGQSMAAAGRRGRYGCIFERQGERLGGWGTGWGMGGGNCGGKPIGGGMPNLRSKSRPTRGMRAGNVTLTSQSDSVLASARGESERARAFVLASMCVFRTVRSWAVGRGERTACGAAEEGRRIAA